MIIEQQYPRSPKELLGGIAHLGRFIDKIRLRHAGKIPDYNYIKTGFDKYLIEFLQIDPERFAQRALTGATDEELLEWTRRHGRQVTDVEIEQWSQALRTSVSTCLPFRMRGVFLCRRVRVRPWRAAR